MNTNLQQNSSEEVWTEVIEGDDSTLPIKQFHHKRVVCDFIVTVRLNNYDECDDDEVTIARFDCHVMKWKYLVSSDSLYEKSKPDEIPYGWYVLAWKRLPKPYKC